MTFSTTPKNSSVGTLPAPNRDGNMLNVRVTMEDGILVAECSPFDVVTQGSDMETLFRRLGLQLAAEIKQAGTLDNVPRLPSDLQF